MCIYLHQSKISVQHFTEIYREKKPEKVSCGRVQMEMIMLDIILQVICYKTSQMFLGLICCLD